MHFIVRTTFVFLTFIVLLPRVTLAQSSSTSRHLSARDSAEVALGKALLERFDADRGVAATPQSQRIEAYLQTIADSLGRHTRRRLPWHIHYDPDPAIKSGFALPGGQIVIWGGVLSYMSTEDEIAAIIAHEIEHTDDGQVDRRIDSLVKTQHREINNHAQWTWDEFGTTYGPSLENLCDYDGAKLVVTSGYSPLGYRMLLQSYLALATAHNQPLAPMKAISDRVAQIDREITTEGWQQRTKTRPIHWP